MCILLRVSEYSVLQYALICEVFAEYSYVTFHGIIVCLSHQAERLEWITMAAPTTWTTTHEPLPTGEAAERIEVKLLLVVSLLRTEILRKYEPGEKCSIEGLH